nr:osteocrin-like [Nerophis lumbriciformis]
MLKTDRRTDSCYKSRHPSLHSAKDEDTLKSTNCDKQPPSSLQMHLCGSLLIICLLSVHVPEHNAREQNADDEVSMRSVPAIAPPDGSKMLRPGRRVKAENDVTEVKRKTGFVGSASPLDRLSPGAFNTKHASNRERVIALPRPRVSLPPLDRIRMRHLPNRRG